MLLVIFVVTHKFIECCSKILQKHILYFVKVLIKFK